MYIMYICMCIYVYMYIIESAYMCIFVYMYKFSFAHGHPQDHKTNREMPAGGGNTADTPIK